MEVYNQEAGTKGKGEEKMASLGGYGDPLADLFGALFYLKSNSIVKLRSKVEVLESRRARGVPRAVLELSVLLTKKGVTFDGPFDTADMQYESARVKCVPSRRKHSVAEGEKVESSIAERSRYCRIV